MISTKDALENAVKILKECNIPDVKNSSEYILATTLKIDKNCLENTKHLSEKQYKKYLKLIEERCNHVPLDKIVGYTDFYDLKFPYNRNVLTPRKETELLAERLVKDIKSILKTNKYESPLSLLDLCAGSGCLGLAVANNTNVITTLSDISKKAIQIAKHNNKLNNLERKKNKQSPINVNFVVSDLFDSINTEFDIIVCNPPYVKTADLQDLEIEVRDFDPILALDGGRDGLDFYRRIIKDAPKFLKSDNGLGKIYLEIGVEQSEPVLKMLEKDFEDIEIIKDYSNIDRFIIAKKRVKDVK